MTRLSQSVAMGVGTAGAFVDVSSYADLEAGVSRSWGRRGEFDDAAPGTFSFTLDNADGRFTPDHPASPLATTVTEGMSVCWQLGSRLVAGTIQAIEPAFPSGESAWAQVRITCDDMLGNAARRSLDATVAGSITAAADEFVCWPMDEDATSIVAYERRDLAGPLTLSPNRLSSGFGRSNVAGLPGTAVALRGNVGTGGDELRAGRGDHPIDYGSDTMGHWGIWLASTSDSAFSVILTFDGLDYPIQFGYANGYYSVAAGSAIPDTYTPDAGPHFVSMGLATVLAAGEWTITATLYLNGSAVASSDYVGAPPSYFPVTVLDNEARQYTSVVISALSASATTTTAVISRLSHTRDLSREELAIDATEAGRLTALDACVPEITLATLPAGLSTAPVGYPDMSGHSALDAISTVIRSEQGAIDTVTTGTLTNPTQVIRVRDRDRTTTPLYTFNAETEASNTTGFVRDLTNLVSAVTAQGPDNAVTYVDETLRARAGSANTTEDVVFQDWGDLYTWATDRVWRGANEELRVAALAVDAFTTPTDRTADLLTLAPGDRIQVTGLPLTQLGLTTWDGWLLGADETQTLTSHEFTLYLQPALAATAIFDTHRFMADGCLSLSSAISSAGASTMSVATTGAKLETSDVPYDLMVDSERVTVTACTGASPQVATITRGVGGTTATTHTTSAAIEIAEPSLFAF